MQELDIAMSHVRTIHRVAGMTGREKMPIILPRTEIYRKLKWRRVSLIEILVIVTVIDRLLVKNALNHSLNQAVLKHT